MSQQYFVSGIDTDCGKTYVTGLLANNLLKQGRNIVTSKLIQTGCSDISEDIIEHRRLMGIDLLPEDKDYITCPYVFSFPASPHLAAEIDNEQIDLNLIKETTGRLIDKYDIVLTEGAGGLMAPITRDYLTIEYIRDKELPLILVSSSKLGSINHTLMSLQLIKVYGIKLHAFVYNQFPQHDKNIAADSFELFKEDLAVHFPETKVWHIEQLNLTGVDF